MARILLAEDDPVLGQLQQSILEAHQHEVVIAEDGEQAQRALVEGGFDILVTDAQMPKITGVELTLATFTGISISLTGTAYERL